MAMHSALGGESLHELKGDGRVRYRLGGVRWEFHDESAVGAFYKFGPRDGDDLGGVPNGEAVCAACAT